MQISKITTFHCDAGWRPWTFVKVETDEGLVGWGECSDSRNAHGVAGAVLDYEGVLLGQEPRAVERLYWDMYQVARPNLGGVAHHAIAGIETALWDVKAKALGVPVYELFGGPLRDRVRVYWSHCGTTRARHGDQLGTPPLRTMADIAELGREVVRRGFTALKTNIVIPGDPASVYMPGFGSGPNSTDGVATPAIMEAIERLIGTFREAVGPGVGVSLDLNYNFRTEGVLRIAKMLERFDLQWLEYDTWDPRALLQIKQSTTTRICSCESLVTTRQYRPFFELHATDVAMVDVPWNGFGAALRVANMAETYEINIAPHNYYSHLATMISANLCAAVPNVRICEIDIDDVPWKDTMVTVCPELRDGNLMIPTGPGWGTELREDVLAEHPWPRPGERGATY